MCNYLGILVSSLLFKKIIKQVPTHECIGLYEEACSKFGLTACFFRINDIEVNKQKMKALVRGEEGDYYIKTITKPLIIHNRFLVLKKRDQNKIDTLLSEGLKIFNESTRYPKLYLYNILSNNKDIRPHLPATLPASKKNFLIMLKNYKEIIIKPNNGTLGEGVSKISYKNNNDLWWHNNREKSKLLSTKKALPKNLEKKINDSMNIIQQRIPLATYHGNPYDIRVSVQKNNLGKWQITGIVAKVARKGMYVTNVASGGTCYPLETILMENATLDINSIKKDIERLSLAICEYLGNSLPNLADVGLDIGITADGFPMLIECNCRDLRYSFKEAGLLDEWKKTYFTPVGYAHYLMEKGNL